MTRRLLICPAAIRALNPCPARWAVYRAVHPTDAPHPFVDILDSNGLDDALWVLGRLPGPVALRLRLLAGAAFAERVLPLFEAEHPTDSRPRNAIAAGRWWADAIGTTGEDAGRAAAWAAWAAAGAAAGDAGRAADGDAEREAQAALLRAIIAKGEGET